MVAKANAKRKRVRRANGKRLRRAARAPSAAPRKVRALVVLTPIAKWERQLAKLQAWRSSTEAAPSMHGEEWKRGQLAHIDKLLAEHQAHKPQTV